MLGNISWSQTDRELCTQPTGLRAVQGPASYFMLIALMPDDIVGPRFVRYFGPVLRALDQLGGSGRPAEVGELVAAELQLPEAVLAETLESGTSRFKNQVAWARFYLAKGGYIDSSKRGVWTLTDKGRAAKSLQYPAAIEVFKAVHQQFPKSSEQDGAPQEPEQEHDDGSPDLGDVSHREQLSEKLLSIPASGFERFCQRLLRESGFEQVTVTGRTGDGGIDGIGLLMVNPLVSFKVLFQCKRYSGSVGSSQVRDFRGAMQGRADKGIIITTGTFTADAKKEAIRDGVPPIELIDGDKLLDMCEELELGLKPVQAYEFDESFFAEFASKSA